MLSNCAASRYAKNLLDVQPFKLEAVKCRNIDEKHGTLEQQEKNTVAV